jgi:hypothetical protein
MEELLRLLEDPECSIERVEHLAGDLLLINHMYPNFDNIALLQGKGYAVYSTDKYGTRWCNVIIETADARIYTHG